MGCVFPFEPDSLCVLDVRGEGAPGSPAGGARYTRQLVTCTATLPEARGRTLCTLDLLHSRTPNVRYWSIGRLLLLLLRRRLLECCIIHLVGCYLYWCFFGCRLRRGHKVVVGGCRRHHHRRHRSGFEQRTDCPRERACSLVTALPRANSASSSSIAFRVASASLLASSTAARAVASVISAAYCSLTALHPLPSHC